MIKALVTFGLVQGLVATAFAVTPSRLGEIATLQTRLSHKQLEATYHQRNFEGNHNKGRFITVGIMGDGNWRTGSGNDRRDPKESDLARDSTGTTWCESTEGKLVLTGSATNICGEVVKHTGGGFAIEKWPRSPIGDRIAMTSHNLMYQVRKSDGTTGSMPYPGACYFYPRGNEPSYQILDEDSEHWLVLRKMRANEDRLRAKIVHRTVNSTNPFSDDHLERGLDSASAVIDRHYSEDGFTCSPIADLRKLGMLEGILSKRNTIKLYGFDTERWQISVVQENCNGETAKPGYVNENMLNTIVDECDTNGKGSGGGIYATFKLRDGSFIEAAFATRVAHIFAERKSGRVPIGLKFNPLKRDKDLNANLAVLIEGNFYKAIKEMTSK